MAFPDRHPCVETGLETQIRYQNDRIGFRAKCPPSDFSSCPHKLANPETAMTLEQDPHAWQEGLSMRSNRQYSALRISS
jgi:hypothetical protein